MNAVTPERKGSIRRAAIFVALVVAVFLWPFWLPSLLYALGLY